MRSRVFVGVIRKVGVMLGWGSFGFRDSFLREEERRGYIGKSCDDRGRGRGDVVISRGRLAVADVIRSWRDFFVES